MTEKPTKTGKELERRVANAYRQMGARKVEHDVELAGNQIDVYVELETPGRLLHHIAVEVKDWSKSVGIDIVNQFATIAGLLRREGLIDEGVIVSAKGFSKQARNAARIYSIRLLEPPDLEAMVTEVRQARMPCIAEGRSQDAVLDALYEHFKSCPASPQMMFGELYKAIGISPNDTKKVGEIRHQLFSLKKKGLAEYPSLQDSSGGTAIITPKGIEAVEDRLRREPPALETAETQEELKSKQEFSEVGISETSPPTLEDLVQGDQVCVSLVQRDDLLNKIKGYLSSTSGRCHFIVLHGEPMVGKTKMLIRLSETLIDEFVPLVVTGQGLDALNSLDAFTFDLAVQLTSKFNRTCPLSLSLAYPEWHDFEPRMGRRAFDAHWRRLRRNAGKRKPLVMFDEIEHLLDDLDQLDPQVLTFLDNFVRNPENGCFIMAGSERLRHSKNEQFSMLIAKGQPIRVRYYDKESVSSIFSMMQEYFTLSEEVLQCLIALCDGHPRLLPAVYQAIRSLGKRKLETSDIEPVLSIVMEQTDDILWALWKRLSADECGVVQLISQSVSGVVSELRYSVHDLTRLAGQPTTGTRIDHRSIARGVTQLEEREWTKWENRNRGLFRFRLGIFPLWARRHYIPLPSRPSAMGIRGFSPVWGPRHNIDLDGVRLG